ncbi:benzoate transport protein [Halalkalibacter wakoensis JCM 9140]|uniref:Benzoate transport protein n=1 Tax=Halalkalibacter wakoensis JCM 9140 TaxID=1236970 RepID=W4Q6M8_9BACI|nr:benzoate/H(+) symporter BenE family transporter [Halalkalibacter wakoensis]GAE27348.1 benzoate transport protein [Halalkalibacter wakoensis JCM 9140]
MKQEKQCCLKHHLKHRKLKKEETIIDLLKKLFGQQGDTFPLNDLNSRNIGAGLVASLLIMTGPAVLLLQAAANGNFTTDQTIFWMFSIYFFGGLYGIIMPLYYRIPIVGGHTITGLAFLATVTSQFGYYELLGAYIFTGILIFVVGYFGIFTKLIQYIPKEILSAMLAGMILKFMLDFMGSVQQMALVGVPALIVFFIFTRWMKRFPPMLMAITTSFLLFWLTQSFEVSGTDIAFAVPGIQVPQFNVMSFLSVAIPLALLILSNDAAVGLGALKQNDYQPNVKQIVSSSGLFSIMTSFFGGQSANIAGMMTAICSDKEAGPKEKRYMGSVVSGVLTILFGILSFKLVPFITSLPQAFISIMIGLGLLSVFTNSLQKSFANPSIKLGAVFSFIIAATNVTVFQIGAPVWALLIGTIIAKVIEKEPDQEMMQSERKSA